MRIEHNVFIFLKRHVNLIKSLITPKELSVVFQAQKKN